MNGALQRAAERGQRLYRSAGFRGAYLAGARAALAGRPVDECPYGRAEGGWRNTYRRAWLRGHGSIPTGEQ